MVLGHFYFTLFIINFPSLRFGETLFQWGPGASAFGLCWFFSQSNVVNIT